MLPINDKDHVVGEGNATVTLVEYGDFECPYCGQAHPVVEEVRKIEGNKLKFVFRNFPLSQVHPHANRAAYAAEAAAKQGKFWQMHDLLFENQSELEDQDLIIYAQSLGLDIKQFNKDMNSQEIAKKVKDDFLSGVNSGVNGTPTFFINGTRFDQPSEVEFLREAIESTAKNIRKEG
jgi:protein-disulfide isomerase